MQNALKGPGRRVRGLSALGMLVVLVVIVVGITLVLRLAPHYIDFYTMNSVIEGLPANEVRSGSRTAIVDLLKKRFSINNLRGFEIRDIIELDRSRDTTVLLLAYERREHLFYNIDVVLTFEKRYEY